MNDLFSEGGRYAIRSENCTWTGIKSLREVKDIIQREPLTSGVVYVKDGREFDFSMKLKFTRPRMTP